MILEESGKGRHAPAGEVRGPRSRSRYRVLVTDGFWRKSVAAVRSLGRAGHHVVVGERTAIAPALYSRHADARFVYPDPGTDPDRFVDALARASSRHRIQVILPMEEETLLLLMRRRDDLPAGVRLPFAPAAAIEAVRDKARLLRRARSVGIPVPRTEEPGDSVEAVEAARSIGYPVVVKPRVGSGARGIAYLPDGRGLVEAFRTASRPGRPAILQERLPPGGSGIGVSALCDRGGEAIALFSHRRIREYPATGGSSTCRESVRAPVLEERARRLLRDLRWRGVAMLEFKQDLRTGDHLLLEMNPRFWGSLSLSIRAGVDFPDLLCRLAMGEAVRPTGRYLLGVRGRTLLPGEILHMITARRRDWRGFLSLAGRRLHFDFCCLDDPFPGAFRIASMIPYVRDGLWNGTAGG